MKNENTDFLNLSEEDFLVKLKGLSEVERKGLMKQRELWTMLKASPEPKPSESVSGNFYDMLSTFKEETSGWGKVKNRFARFWDFQPQFKLAYGLAILIVGIVAGVLMDRTFSDTSQSSEVAVLSAEVKQMKEMMLLSLLKNPSASERIRAVSFTEEITDVNQKVIKALFTTLNNDDNDNVRIMTLEALATMADKPIVREGLVASITRQESPLVQSAMADVMVTLQERKAMNGFRILLKKDDLNEGVKMKIEESMSEIL